MERERPAAVCIAALPPGGLAHTRYLCKRLRQRFPAVKLLVGRWGLKGNVEENRTALAESGADHVGTTLQETLAQLTEWQPVFQADAAAEPKARAKAAEKVGQSA